MQQYGRKLGSAETKGKTQSNNCPPTPMGFLHYLDFCTVAVLHCLSVLRSSNSESVPLTTTS